MQPQTYIHPVRIAIREATATDGPALDALAALDSQPLPDGPLLVAEIDGVVDAALPLAGAPVIANPFVHTADAVALLEARVRQIREGRSKPSHLRRARPAYGQLRAA